MRSARPSLPSITVLSLGRRPSADMRSPLPVLGGPPRSVLGTGSTGLKMCSLPSIWPKGRSGCRPAGHPRIGQAASGQYLGVLVDRRTRSKEYAQETPWRCQCRTTDPARLRSNRGIHRQRRRKRMWPHRTRSRVTHIPRDGTVQCVQVVGTGCIRKTPSAPLDRSPTTDSHRYTFTANRCSDVPRPRCQSPREPTTPRIAGSSDPIRVVRYSRLWGPARAILDLHGRLFVWNRSFDGRFVN